MLTCWACRHYRARIYGGCAIGQEGYPSVGASCVHYRREEAGTDGAEQEYEETGWVSFESDSAKS